MKSVVFQKTLALLAVCFFVISCAPPQDAIPSTPTPVPAPAPPDVMLVHTTEFEQVATKIIEDAQEYVIVAAFTFTYQPIVEKLIEATQRGIPVTVVLSSRAGTQSKELMQQLEASGAKVHYVTGVALFHEKFISSEHEALIMSANISERGFTYNYETGVYTTNQGVIQELYNHLQDVISGRFRLGKFGKTEGHTPPSDLRFLFPLLLPR